MQRIIFEVKHVHLVRQASSRAKGLHEVRAGVLSALLVLALCFTAHAQVNTGSTGADGALDFSAISYATNVVIDMSDHPTGIYNYTYVSIPTNVTVTFIPNANNSPVTWLASGNCTIAGIVSVRGKDSSKSIVGANGGPGGSRGGNGTLAPGLLPEAGLGLGGGQVGANTNWSGGNGSYATIGSCNTVMQTNTVGVGSLTYFQYSPGNTYGNVYELPLLGGSGGSGDGMSAQGGGGGGGAILIAASGSLAVSGSILAGGGNGFFVLSGYNGPSQTGYGGAGSGGAIRLIGSTVTGNGNLDTTGGEAGYGYWYGYFGAGGSIDDFAGNGRIRIEGLSDTFNGTTGGVTTYGYTGIIFMPSNQQPQLLVISVGGVPVSASPTGVLSTPDAFLSAQQNNPIPIVVNCSNLPLNTLITVRVTPASGASISATGYNTAGTQTTSTATISINMPRGGGLIYATAATGN